MARRHSVKNIPYAIDLDGAVGTFVEAGTGIYQFERTDPFSFSFWYKPRSIVSTQYLFSDTQGASPVRGILFRVQASLIRVYLVNTFGSNEMTVNFNLTPEMLNKWMHVTITYDGSVTAGGLKGYYNSVLETPASTVNTLTDTIVDATNKVRWGAWGNASGSVNHTCVLTKMRVFDYELTQAQVDELYYEDKVIGTAPLTEYLATTGSGSNLVDTGSLSTDATLNGGYTWVTNTPSKKRTAVTQARTAVTQARTSV